MSIEYKGYTLPNISFKSGSCDNESWDLRKVSNHKIKPKYVEMVERLKDDRSFIMSKS